MREERLAPFGARVLDLALADVGETEVVRLRELLATHGVVVIPDQDTDDVTFLRFLRGFGEVMVSVGETPVEQFPDLNVISNVGRTTPPRSTFHVDTSYVSRPPAYTALRAVTIPSRAARRCSATSTSPRRPCPPSSSPRWTDGPSSTSSPASSCPRGPREPRTTPFCARTPCPGAPRCT